MNLQFGILIQKKIYIVCIAENKGPHYQLEDSIL